MLRDDLLSPIFFRTCIELSVATTKKVEANDAAPPLKPYQDTDAFSKLSILLIKAVKGIEGQIVLAVKIFSIIVLVLVHMQELNPNDFDQKPFLRIFSSILNELKPMEKDSPVAYHRILVSLRFTTDLTIAIPFILCVLRLYRLLPFHGFS